jgi:hypothetical protein
MILYRNFWSISAFILLVSVSSCKAKLKKNSKKFQKLYLSVQTTPCFGTCPIYKIQVFGNGNATLNAERFTENHHFAGEYHIELPDSTLLELFSMAYPLNWNNYQKEYRSGYSDLPGVVISFSKTAGDTMAIYFEKNYGPKELELIADKIEQLRIQMNWGKAKEILE